MEVKKKNYGVTFYFQFVKKKRKIQLQKLIERTLPLSTLEVCSVENEALKRRGKSSFSTCSRPTGIRQIRAHLTDFQTLFRLEKQVWKWKYTSL